MFSEQNRIYFEKKQQFDKSSKYLESKQDTSKQLMSQIKKWQGKLDKILNNNKITEPTKICGMKLKNS